jgi:osmoprotectant transport system permease protein
VGTPVRGAGGEAGVNVVQWLTDAAHWSGENGIPARLFEHLELCIVAMLMALVISLPIGIVVGHTRRGAGASISVANIGRAVPSFAVLVIAFIAFLHAAPKLAFGFGPTIVALTLLAIPPILVNTVVGIEGIDPDALDAARGMGLGGREILRRLELPLAVPLIMTGVRIAAVSVVATATLAALIAGGGLGRYIVDGFAQGDRVQASAGAVLVAALAILTELVLGAVQRLLTPRTSSQGRRLRPEKAASLGSVP